MNDQERIEAGLLVLKEKFNGFGLITRHIKRLNNCNIKFKTWNPIYLTPKPYGRFPWLYYEASTTYGPRLVRLSEYLRQATSLSVARILLHEAVHCLQYDKHKWFRTRYLFNREFRETMEADAYEFTRKIMGF